MRASSITSRDRVDGAGLRLYTHNIWGRHDDWKARRRVLVDGIQALDPDVITLQETVVNREYDQVADLLGAGWHVAHSRQRAADGTGISLASRWPIAHVDEPDLNVTPRTAGFPCTAMLAEIDAPAPFGSLLLVNHFPDYQVDHERERELQTVLVAKAVEARLRQRAAHVLLAGDLDAEPDAASLRFLSGKQSLDDLSVCYRDAWEACHPVEPGGTFVAANPLAPDDWPFARIDHVFVRCGEHGGPTLGIAGCELAFNEPVGDVWASDHFGLVADFRPR